MSLAKLVGTVLLVSISFIAFAQTHSASYPYIPPRDPLVIEKLSNWKSQKFGLMMHWGTYSQWGIVESWSICPEDEDWTIRRGPFAKDWFSYLKAYEALQTSFNPLKFNPQKWAKAAQEAGMKYLVFTTKHHDGFCMFDSQETDYKITSPLSPFAKHKKANITKEIFTAFREKDFSIGAYFSKPDWHNEFYWWKYFPPKSRNVSYDPKKYPAKWENFKSFTYRQIQELMKDYGKIDILWLDGGWVRPFNSIDSSIEWQRTIPYNQDIDLPKIATMARALQPGLLVVDRTVHGEYENYVTPEQQVPSHYLPYPWESCITLGNSWSYVPNDQYKSSRKIIHLLTDIISKNGNLLLNIGPDPSGDWDPIAYQRLSDIGKWINRNQEAIYHANADSLLVKQGNFVFTRKQQTVYAIYQLQENERPNQLSINIKHLKGLKSIHLLDTKQQIPFQINGNICSFTLAPNLQETEALVFAINF